MNELYHYGMPRRSGRYPYGSGERPFQSLRERSAAKNLKIGKERLTNRINRANKLADVDRLSKKIGWKYSEQAGKAHAGIKNLKQVTSEILSDDERTRSLGRYTKWVRVGTVGLTSTVAGSLAVGGSAFVTTVLGLPIASVALPIAAAGATAKIGYDYFQKTKY